MYLIKFILEKHVYKVLRAYTGYDGLIIAIGAELDLILIDW